MPYWTVLPTQFLTNDVPAHSDHSAMVTEEATISTITAKRLSLVLVEVTSHRITPGTVQVMPPKMKLRRGHGGGFVFQKSFRPPLSSPKREIAEACVPHSYRDACPTLGSSLRLRW